MGVFDFAFFAVFAIFNFLLPTDQDDSSGVFTFLLPPDDPHDEGLELFQSGRAFISGGGDWRDDPLGALYFLGGGFDFPPLLLFDHGEKSSVIIS